MSKIRDLAEATGVAVWVWVVGVIVIAGTSAFFLWVQPYLLDRERTNVTHSRQYVQTQKTKLLQLCTEWDDLQTQEAIYKNNSQVLSTLSSQESGLIRQMKETSGLIPQDEVPSCVKEKITNN
jgi:hypothetical protein